jgi:hypothetical protein
MTDNHTRTVDNAGDSARRLDLLRALLEADGSSSGVVLGRRGLVRVPLSFAQARLWFLEQLIPGTGVYNLAGGVRWRFGVDVEALGGALSGLAARHEVLRTTFVVADGEPVQVVGEPFAVQVPVVDLGAVPVTQREDEAVRLATEEARRPFDLAVGPLLRAKLLRLGVADFVFVVTMHHIVSDGWSMAIFWRELAALYEAETLGRAAALPALPVQYGDYAAWQREWLSGELLERQLAYWRERLAGLPQLGLPTDRPRPAVQSFRGAHHPVAVSAEVTRQLKALAQQEGATLFMVLLAAFCVLLARYSGQSDIVVGSPIAGRTRAELESLIGFFINTLVLRCDVSGEPTFRELVGRVREVALGAYAHQDIPFEKLVEEVQPERDLSRNPLCQVSMQVFSAPKGAQVAGPAAAATSVLELDRGNAVFDLVLTLWEHDQGLGGHIEYSCDLFDAATIDRLARHFLTLLSDIVAGPDRHVRELRLLSDAERHRTLVEWNATEHPVSDQCVHQLIEAQAVRTPDAPAVTYRPRKAPSPSACPAAWTSPSPCSPP